MPPQVLLYINKMTKEAALSEDVQAKLQAAPVVTQAWSAQPLAPPSRVSAHLLITSLNSKQRKIRSFPRKGVTGGNLSTTRVATERGEKPRRVCGEARSSAQVPAIACLLTELRHRAGAGKRRGSPLTARLFLGQARGGGEGTSGPPGIAGGGGHRSGRGRPAPPRGWGRAGPNAEAGGGWCRCAASGAGRRMRGGGGGGAAGGAAAVGGTAAAAA